MPYTSNLHANGFVLFRLARLHKKRALGDVAKLFSCVENIGGKLMITGPFVRLDTICILTKIRIKLFFYSYHTSYGLLVSSIPFNTISFRVKIGLF